ncbi:MAG: hypothetical protein M0P31_14750 [Solirubrobacteraceae bacterium]|nr:hypothetical protein [Solirubrobacteraceae bacterium]
MTPRPVPPPTPGPALWDAIAGLPLRIDRVDREPLERATPRFVRRVTIVRLSGDGHDGVGEDVDYDPDDHPRFQAWDGLPDLRGDWTIGTFCDRVGELDLFPVPPAHDVDRRYRRWAFESAALDLALRQSGRSLADVVERQVRPLTFASSRGLGDPPDPAAIADLRRRVPGLGLKLDLGEAWTVDAIAAVHETGAVEVVDLKGWYTGTIVDTPADPALYRAVIEGLPDAWIEDARTTDDTRPILDAHADRLTWDLPLQDAADLDAFPWEPRVVNVKPSRIGGLRELSAVYAACTSRGIGAYAGGQFELGPGRGQAQLLAALFHPDGPNDLAPFAYNEVELVDAPPASPLTLEPASVGFRLAAD